MRPRPSVALLAVAATLVGLTACGGGSTATSPANPAPSSGSAGATNDLPPAPEPAIAPPPTRTPAGRVVDVGSPVEGVVVDGVTRTVAAALRGRRLALLDADSGAVRTTVGVPGTARHLQLAKPGGPVLVPGEDTDLLTQVGLPAGQVIVSARVGRQPHDAAFDPESGRVVVTDELGGSVSFVEGDHTVARLPGPVQPGGLAVVGGRAAVVDVRGAALYVYDVAGARQIARLDAGNGPTHAVPLPGDRVAVADTRGGAVLIFALDGTPRLLEQIPLADGPYGIGVDEQRGRLYVALSATNLLVRYDVGTGSNSGTGALRRVGPELPTVQQANSLGVDPRNGRLFIGSSVDPGQVQMTDPPG